MEKREEREEGEKGWFGKLNKIICGDSIEELKKLPENSVDAIVTDPPYGLEFMGKEWDKFSGDNPNDQYKSKGNFKAERESGGSFDKRIGVKLGSPKKNPVCKKCGHYKHSGTPCKCETPDWDTRESEFKLDLQGFCYRWAIECLRVLKPGGFLLSFGGTRTYHRMVCGIEDAGFEIRDCIQWLYGSGFPKSLNIGKQIDKIQGNVREPDEYTGANFKNNVYGNAMGGGYTKKYGKGKTDWEGWGTALKPANEPIVVARKPLSEKNVALNVLKWGTGRINIDGCRIGTETIKCGNAFVGNNDGRYNFNNGTVKEWKGNIATGRFPANIILDEEAGKMLGEPSRFFYCAKASKSERNEGCTKNNHPTVKPIKLMEYLIKLVSKEGATILDPFLGSGTTAIACAKLNRKCIGIEKEPEYIKIAEARLKPFLNQSKLNIPDTEGGG